MFYKHVTSFNFFNDCNYHVIVEVVCSSVMQKVFCKFTATVASGSWRLLKSQRSQTKQLVAMNVASGNALLVE